MKNTIGISKLALFILSVSICYLRLIQLVKYTDSSTGLINEKFYLSYGVYALIILAGVFAALYSKSVVSQEQKLHFIGNGNLSISMLLLCFAFFYDFIHQCFNAYGYINELEVGAVVEYNYLIPLILSGVLSLISAFYVVISRLTLKGFNYDFRRLTLLHFIPFLWAFCKLVMIMVRIVDVQADAESFCEFIFLSNAIVFMLCCITAIDFGDMKVRQSMAFFDYMTVFSSTVIAIPRLVIILMRRGQMINHVTFSCITYLAIGFFAYELMLSFKEESRTV